MKRYDIPPSIGLTPHEYGRLVYHEDHLFEINKLKSCDIKHPTYQQLESDCNELKEKVEILKLARLATVQSYSDENDRLRDLLRRCIPHVRKVAEDRQAEKEWLEHGVINDV